MDFSDLDAALFNDASSLDFFEDLIHGATLPAELLDAALFQPEEDATASPAPEDAHAELTLDDVPDVTDFWASSSPASIAEEDFPLVPVPEPAALSLAPAVEAFEGKMCQSPVSPAESFLEMPFEMAAAAEVVPQKTGGSKAPMPSKFCHLCSRRASAVNQIVCGNFNNAKAQCRKVVCERCFEKQGWDWAATVADPASWRCTHCTGSCPDTSQCVHYKKTNEKIKVGRVIKKKVKAQMVEVRPAFAPIVPLLPRPLY